MKLAIPELLAGRRWTPADLAEHSEGRISRTVAYRLAADDWQCLSRTQLDGLCLAFGLDHPGPLFTRDRPKRKRKA